MAAINRNPNIRKPNENLMNFHSKPSKKLSWQKIVFAAILVCIIGYKYYNENFAGPAVARPAANQQGDNHDYSVDFDGNGNSSNQNGDRFKPLKQSSSGSFLTSSGGKNLRSPAGLVYGMGGGGEHRTDHVLRHAEDQPNRRGNHGVFNAKGDDVFRLIDEAYELVKSKSRQVDSKESRGNMAHVIDMKRRIGFKGGQNGNRDGKPPLSKIKLILAGGNRVITAYPY